MIDQKIVETQLKKINFNPNGWGRTEVRELCSILLPDEEIQQAVNGWYEAGFALLIATKHRVLLVDKKPLNYLTVEDMRFDMISEFDYSHRLIGAHVCINSNSKTFNFTSLNQQRLRALITYVQNRMTELKQIMHEQQETQQQHLESMNEQLRQYLVAMQQQQLQQAQLTAQQSQTAAIGVVAAMAPMAAVNTSAAFEAAAAHSLGTLDALPASPAQEAIPAYVEATTVAPQESTASAVDSEAHRHIATTPQQICLAAARRVVPVISAYSRVPMISSRQRFQRSTTAPGTA